MNHQSSSSSHMAWEMFFSHYGDKKQGMMELCERLGYTFQQREYLYEAMTHRSALSELLQKLWPPQERGPIEGLPWNERLEFLGDSVLSLAVSTLLWRRSHLANEGEYSRVRAVLVQESTLAEVARSYDFGRCVVLGPAMESSGGYDHAGVLADALEAFLGALYLDAGFERTLPVVERLFSLPLQGCFEDLLLEDHKTCLQERTQRRYGSPPSYHVVYERGPDHCKEFVVECRLQEHLLGVGVGSSKKKASQEAAAKALQSQEWL